MPKSQSIDLGSMNILGLSRVNLNKLNTRQLRQFIRTSMEIAEEAFDTDNEQLQKSVSILSNKLGTRTTKGETHLVRGVAFLRKSELQKKARLLQQHLAIDVFTNRAEYEREEMNKEARDKISKQLGVEMDEDEFDIFVMVMHDLRKISDKFDSTEASKMISSVIEEARDIDADATDILMTIHETYEESVGKGMTMNRIQDAVMEKLRNIL